jgi:excisionase family DNA binding protein
MSQKTFKSFNSFTRGGLRMAAQQPRFSPKQVARALEVSESSIKRWCDKGAIPTVRTNGGHRRITLDALQAFIRDSGRELRIPDVLGLPKLSRQRTSVIPGKDEPIEASFREGLAGGDETACRQLLTRLIEAGTTRGEACERLITDAMHGFGEAWSHDRMDVYQERRGCDICIRLINQQLAQLPTLPSDAPVAVGGAPEGDPYQLPTALIELALREAGWRATSLGNNLPLQSFLQASHDHRPKLVWLSVSAINNPATFVAQENRLADLLSDEVSLIVGGRALSESIRPRLRYTAHCDNIARMLELAEVMRTA